MLTFDAKDYYAEFKSPGVLEVFAKEKKKIEETTIIDGKPVTVVHMADTTTNDIMRQMLLEMDSLPCMRIAAANTGKDRYHIDYVIEEDDFTRRWKGIVKVDGILEGLIQCGFDKNDIHNMLDMCADTPHEYMEKVG